MYTAKFLAYPRLLRVFKGGPLLALLMMAARCGKETQGREHKDVQSTAGIPATEAGRPPSKT
jgi:hypothetical protein